MRLRCSACAEEASAYFGFDLVPSADSSLALDSAHVSECDCELLSAILANTDNSNKDKASLQGEDQNRICALTRAGARVPLLTRSRMLPLSTRPNPWNLIELESAASSPYENPDLIGLSPIIAMIQNEQPIVGNFRVKAREKRSVLGNQSVCLVPVGEIGSWNTPDMTYILLAQLKNSLVTDIASQCGLSERFEFPFMVPFEDEFVQASMLALEAEARADYCSGAIYGDTLATALAVHLLQHYNLQSKKIFETKGGLSARDLSIVLEFVHENFQQDIGLSDLCGLVNMSSFHFSRLFKVSTGMSPYQYMLHFRVKRARELIARGDNLKQVATSVGFWDVSHLTRHFKRIYGYAPSAETR